MIPVVLWSRVASASEVDFTPDRPGVGDSTGTPGRGHAMIEAGLAGTFGGGSAVFGTSGLIGRLGVDDGLELRLRLPDLLADGGLVLGTAGIGAKVGAEAGERWSVSMVSELSIDPGSGAVGGALGGNVALALGSVGLWAHGSAAGDEGPVGVLAGGGASAEIGRGGAYLHGGLGFDGTGFAGGGGWWMLADALQVDLGCDLLLGGGAVVAAPLAGIAVGF